MSENPPRSISMSLCVLLASLVFAIAPPVFAKESGDEPVAAPSDLAPEPASDVAPDLSAIKDLERQMRVPNALRSLLRGRRLFRRRPRLRAPGRGAVGGFSPLSAWPSGAYNGRKARPGPAGRLGGRSAP